MNKAKNFTQFYAALSKQELSMFNIMYADKHDTVFYINNALMPIREEGFNWKRTVPGNTSKTLWTNFRTLKELPQYINPKSGFLFNTNHSSFLATAKEDNLNPQIFKPQDGWEQYHLNRSVRFLELFPQTEQLSFEKFKQIKFDKQLPATLQYSYKLDSMYLVNETDYPEYAPVITTFKKWDKRGDAANKGAAVFLLTYEYVKKTLKARENGQVTMPEAIEIYKHVTAYIQTNFKRTDITLGDLQKLVRGEKDWPLGGFPDLLSPQWTTPYKDGKLKSIGGDGLIMFVRFPKQGLPVIETVNMYGASAHAGNKHFDDQVEMYLQQQTKKMTLDKAEVYKTAEKIYHPL